MGLNQRILRTDPPHIVQPAQAMWVIEVKNFPVVTMDSHGGSQHALFDEQSKKVLDDLFEKA